MTRQLQQAIADVLTPHQRRVLFAGVPLVRMWGHGYRRSHSLGERVQTASPDEKEFRCRRCGTRRYSDRDLAAGAAGMGMGGATGGEVGGGGGDFGGGGDGGE